MYVQEWFMGLDPMMQAYWSIAIIATVIFLVQMILTFIGIDSVDGADIDVDFSDGDTMDTGGAISLFSIRSLINFAVGLGWAGICLRSSISNDIFLGVVSVVVGIGFGALYPIVWSKMRRLESNGAFHLNECIGKDADVYLRIPANGNGKGKVQISINGSIHEFDAISDGEEIPTGRRVRIKSLHGNVFKVEL